MSCAICEKRKPKRFCPAIHGHICPQCCGEQREVTLNCPRECVYLQQARQHEKARPIEGIEQSGLFPNVEVGEQFLYEQEHLIVGLSYAITKSVRSDLSIRDSDAIAALTALARSYDTLANSGLHYETQQPSLIHQKIAGEIQKMVKEFREAEQKHVGYSKLRDSDVLRALVFLVRLGISRNSGRPKSRAFVDFLDAQFPEQQSAIASVDEGSRIIVP